MPEQLPIYFDQHSDPRIMKLVYAYRPHTPIPTKEELKENSYNFKSYVSVKDLTKQLGLDYKKEIQRRG